MAVTLLLTAERLDAMSTFGDAPSTIVYAFHSPENVHVLIRNIISSNSKPLRSLPQFDHTAHCLLYILSDS